MRTQFSLPGFDLDPPDPPARQDLAVAKPSGPPTHRLFLGLFPSLDDAARIDQNADLVCKHFGLAGKRLKTDRLHITLHSLGDYVGAVPETLIEQAMAVAATVVCPPVDVRFDHALSFPGSGAFVLCGHDNAAVDVLRQRLSVALKHAGIKHYPSRKPHMTLLYDRRSIAEHAIEPIHWTATEFVLILSHLGKTHHEWLARWPLTGMP